MKTELSSVVEVIVRHLVLWSPIVGEVLFSLMWRRLVAATSTTWASPVLPPSPILLIRTSNVPVRSSVNVITSCWIISDSIKVFFVVRVKDNLLYERIEERELPDKAHPEVLIDEIVRLTGNDTAEQYPRPIRRIAVYNARHGFTILLFAVLKQQAAYKWHFSNLVSSLRLNTFTKIDLFQWINKPFTPPPEEELET